MKEMRAMMCRKYLEEAKELPKNVYFKKARKPHKVLKIGEDIMKRERTWLVTI